MKFLSIYRWSVKTRAAHSYKGLYILIFYQDMFAYLMHYDTITKSLCLNKWLEIGRCTLKQQEYTRRKSYSAYQYKPIIWHRVLIPSAGKKEFLQEQQVAGKHLNVPSSACHLRISKLHFKHLLLIIELSNNALFFFF